MGCLTRAGASAPLARREGEQVRTDVVVQYPGKGIPAVDGTQDCAPAADEAGESAEEEFYLVHRGRARFELDGEQVDAPAGTLVFARPGVKRTAFAEEAGTTVVELGGTPGKAYEPSGFEIWSPLGPLYEAGEYAEAADRGRELIDAHPEYAGVLYSVACCESLSGRTADAMGHLRLAIERSERCRSFAAGDSDFDPICDESAFKELVG